MANIKSSKKRSLQNLKRRKNNIGYRSMIRTFVKKVHFSIRSGDKERAKDTFLAMQKIVDRQSRRKIIHKNKAARYKSKLSKRINNM